MRMKARIGGRSAFPGSLVMVQIFRGYQGLVAEFGGLKRPFLLASAPRILYPDTRLACERPWP
jgi:hypothetical protein